ncbi:MAG: tetratricopeptide repeat protein [Pirellulales bacterium]|nr:tetratricopeptide repeat protein [Pirellulales bacterium]
MSTKGLFMMPTKHSQRRTGGFVVIIISACFNLMSSPVSGSPIIEPASQTTPLLAPEPARQSRSNAENHAVDMISRFDVYEKRISRYLDIDAFTDERDARGEYVNLLARVFGDGDWHTVTQRLYHESIGRVCRLTSKQQSLIVKARKSWKEGTRLRGSHKYLSALASFEDASRIYRELLGDNDVWTIAARVETAQMQQMSHKFKEAKATLENVVPQIKALYGEDDPCYAEMLQSLGVVNFNLASYDQSEIQFRTSLKIQQITNGVESYQASIGHYHLAYMYNQRRQFLEAESEAKSASRIVARMLPDKYMENILALWQLGRSRLGQEKHAEAASDLARAIQLIDAYGISPPDSFYMEILDAYATALQKLNRDEEAAKYRSRADALRAKQQKNQDHKKEKDAK